MKISFEQSSVSPMSITEVPTAVGKGAFVLEKKESMGREYTQQIFTITILDSVFVMGEEKKEKINK